MNRIFNITDSNRLSWLDIMKFLGITGIVFGHISTYTPANSIMYSVYVPLFFFTSGWLYRQRPIIEDIKRRSLTILVPYFTFGIITLIYYNVFEHRYRDVDLSLKDTLFGLFSGIFDYLEFNSPLWFLPCFFITSVLYNIAQNRTNKTVTYIFCTALYIIYVIAQPLASLPCSIDRTLELLIFYAAGNITSEKRIDIFFSKLNIVLKIIIIAVCFFISFVITYYGIYHGFLLFPCGISGIISLMLLSMLLNKITFLSSIGRMTLLIMLIHGPIYRVLVKITAILMSCGTDTVRGNLILSFLLSLATISICVIANIILSKIAPWSIGIKKTHSKSRTTM